MIDKDKKTYHIILAEDSEADIDLFLFALKKTNGADIDLLVLEDGEKLMKYLKKEPPYENAKKPDLILLDINMPKMNGIEALMEIKRNELLKTIPVLMLTSSNKNEDILTSYKNYANSYILKPLNVNEFVNVVKSIKQHWLKNVRLPSVL